MYTSMSSKNLVADQAGWATGLTMTILSGAETLVAAGVALTATLLM